MSALIIVLSAIFPEVTAKLAILAFVIALSATLGKSAVPVKSPANLTFPLTVVVASGAPDVTLAST